MLEILFGTFKHTLQITLFVISMMLVIEYFTVQSKNRLIESLSKNIWLQVILAAIFGVIPGCLGTFLVVSLYAHKIVNLSALVSAMIATSGDEAFVMFAEIPKQALILNIVIFLIAIITGFLMNIFLKDKNLMQLKENHLTYHKGNIECVCFDKKNFFTQLKNITFERALLMFFSFLFVISILSGELGPQKWNYIRFTLLFVGIFVLFISTTVPDHFLKEHLWQHTIKKHSIKIFLWTFGALLVIEIILPYLNITEENFRQIAEQYKYWILILAVLIGIIPESGPHLIFIFLYSHNYIPFSILLANSIVQDGHGGLPLLAESRKSFFVVKMINIFVGLIIGLLGMLIFKI